MSDNHLAFIFPAFTSDYSDHPGQNAPEFNDRFGKFLVRAADLIDPELAGFDFTEKTFLQDELRTQYITFIYSCTISELLRREGYSPVITAGYSMGIYAALFDAGSISYETGLLLIRSAYQSLQGSLNNESYSMGALIGLSDTDIQELIDHHHLRIEITNQNASHSFVVSGYRDDIQILMQLAREQGALHVRDLAVSIPYHSSYLKEGAMDFSGKTIYLNISAPKSQLFSLIDQTLLSTADSTRQETVRNLYQPLNWYLTMQILLYQNITHYIECGPSTGLGKNAKFVNGIKFSPLPSILRGSGAKF